LGKLSPGAEAVRKEAQRRIDLHLAKSAERDKPGNRLRMVGHSNNPAYKGLEHLVSTPGNTPTSSTVSVSPTSAFRKEVDSKLAERNDTSVVDANSRHIRFAASCCVENRCNIRRVLRRRDLAR
jgi:hypothetical protein